MGSEYPKGFWPHPSLLAGEGAGGEDAHALLAPLDLYETPRSYVVEIEAAGIPPEDLKIVLEQGNLVIEGIRRERKMVGEKVTYRQVERRFGPIRRVVPLPLPVTPPLEKEYRNGLVIITILKASSPPAP